MSSGDRAAQHWEQVLHDAGLDGFDAATTPREMLAVIGPALEAIFGGMIYLRYGGGPHNLAPDPEAGVEYESAREVFGVLREMAAAPARSRDAAADGE